MNLDTQRHFPIDDYTPHGYIDNPAHCRFLNMSGVIRSHPAIGMGWWYPTGRFDDDDDAGTEYASLLQLGFRIGETSLATPEDFAAAGIGLVSRYHTKNVMSFDFEHGGLSVSVCCLLVHEHFLSCLLAIGNGSSSDAEIDVTATHIYKTVVRRWWGADGIAGSYLPEEDAIVQTIWAGGHVFALGASEQSTGHDFAYSEAEWAEKHAAKLANVGGGTVRKRDPLYGMMGYKLTVPAGDTREITFGLARGMNRAWTLDTLRSGMSAVDAALAERLEDDNRFYASCPTLTGDWPDHWKRGWVYDWETQRMNSREPVGIYKHHWDAMLIHEPRVVLAETAIDSMMLSYADPELAREELYGVFADAPSPQVPCTREDGSMNMIAADGSECGTAPSWCFPFRVIHSVYCRYPDSDWLRKLYPYLAAYLEWWFANRTDDDGWFHCKCSWESGQDGSRRFLVEGNPGAVSDYVRTVDVESSVAEALANMAVYAGVLGMREDEKRWRDLAHHRAEHTREMYVDGWYRDIDARTGQPIYLDDYYDIMMLAPVTCGIAAAEQIEAISPMFEYFVDHPHFWLEWPSFMFPFTDAAWYSGRNQLVADAIHTTADRVYRRLDSREVTWWDRDALLYRVPGVSYEFWPDDERCKGPGGGSENYGWGASMPTNVIRGIFGFHESLDPGENLFYLSPTIPSALAIPGRAYGITGLRYRGLTIDVSCEVLDANLTRSRISIRSESPVTVNLNSGSEQPSEGSGARVEFDITAARATRFTISIG